MSACCASEIFDAIKPFYSLRPGEHKWKNLLLNGPVSSGPVSSPAFQMFKTLLKRGVASTLKIGSEKWRIR